MTELALTIFGLCLVTVIRSFLAFRIGMKRLNYIHERNRKALDNGTYNKSMMADYDMVNHNAMVFDLTKWTYKQFFPEE